MLLVLLALTTTIPSTWLGTPIVVQKLGPVVTGRQYYTNLTLEQSPCQLDLPFCLGVPTEPRSLQINQLRRSTDRFNRTRPVIELSWDTPSEMHGELQGYEVAFEAIGYPTTVSGVGGDEKVNLEGSTDCRGEGSLVHPRIMRNLTEMSYTSKPEDALRKCSPKLFVAKRWKNIFLNVANDTKKLIYY
ncbi:unnamed protein product [Protopolystoma xenopodis]|uniref:Fibronectin type-III domain-containing protein n=1 Tax=Protopolystoma xenopodis TaxID=117903 RepID=A0A448XJZ5_9PLAT|nr:unnamed protein product [Protopolystoma xenopodis]